MNRVIVMCNKQPIDRHLFIYAGNCLPPARTRSTPRWYGGHGVAHQPPTRDAEGPRRDPRDPRRRRQRRPHVVTEDHLEELRYTIVPQDSSSASSRRRSGRGRRCRCSYRGRRRSTVDTDGAARLPHVPARSRVMLGQDFRFVAFGAGRLGITMPLGVR